MKKSVYGLIMIMAIVTFYATILTYSIQVPSMQSCEEEEINTEVNTTQEHPEDSITIIPDTFIVCREYVSELWLRKELKTYNIPDDDIERFIYIAKRESNLNAKAFNGTLNSDKTTDTGLFQINSIHKNLAEKYDLFCPKENLSAAMDLYCKVGFKPWYTIKERTAYREGYYDETLWRDYVPEKNLKFL